MFCYSTMSMVLVYLCVDLRISWDVDLTGGKI